MTSEQAANALISMMLSNRRGKHVYRVASWLGFLLGGLDKLSADYKLHGRQLWFRLPQQPNKWFKARFAHGLMFGNVRGGIQFVERDNEAVIATFGCLEDARRFYDFPLAAWTLPAVARQSRQAQQPTVQ